MSTTPDKLVERYLKHLEVELDDVPRDRRREIVDEIAGHIAEARAGLEHESEADVRNILEGLGDPADIAEDARERFDVQPPAQAQPFKPGWMEIAALVLLLIGGIVIPFFGWVIGVVLLWASNAWNVRDKIIGTVLVPGGLALSAFLLFYAAARSGEGTSLGTLCEADPATGQQINCHRLSTGVSSAGVDFTQVLGTLLLIGIVVVPIVTTAYLGYRLRHRPPAAMA
jgi:uncharacterized membrane protein